jgi:hypothetical protein
MRKLVVCGLAVVALSACGHRGFDRDRPDEFAVARQAPLVIPPDFSLTPPSPGAARTQTTTGQDQTLEALFGPDAARSAAERGALNQAGTGSGTETGIRSSVGDPGTNVVDKGQTTSAIVAAPEGDNPEAQTSAPK